MNLRDDIKKTINFHCAENGPNTPDFILAEYLTDCLAAFDKAASRREQWYGRANRLGDAASSPEGPTR